MAVRLRAESNRWQVVQAPTYLAGIAQAPMPDLLGVLVGIDQGPRRLDAAVAGLRAAAGDRVPILLCCRPHAEPLARRLLTAGADDYLISPPSREELERALGLPAEFPSDAVEADRVTTSIGLDEMAELGDVLDHLQGSLHDVLTRLANLACRALEAQWVEVAAFGQSARVGQGASPPDLTEGLTHGAELIGRVTLGPRRIGTYTAGQMAKCRGYARVFGGLLGSHHRESQARQQAMTDSVSGLRNRRFLDHFLPGLLERATRQRFRVTLLLFDIDDFKHYNDTYGHAAGDEIIREIGQLMQRCCRRHDVVVRFGGDEFAVVFWDADQPRKAGSQHPSDPLTVVDRFRDALLNHRFPGLGPEAGGKLTISGGLATFPWEAAGAEELIRRADAALIDAKQQGKNRVLHIGGRGGWAAPASDPGAATTEEK